MSSSEYSQEPPFFPWNEGSMWPQIDGVLGWPRPRNNRDFFENIEIITDETNGEEASGLLDIEFEEIDNNDVSTDGQYSQAPDKQQLESLLDEGDHSQIDFVSSDFEGYIDQSIDQDTDSEIMSFEVFQLRLTDAGFSLINEDVIVQLFDMGVSEEIDPTTEGDLLDEVQECGSGDVIDPEITENGNGNAFLKLDCGDIPLVPGPCPQDKDCGNKADAKNYRPDYDCGKPKNNKEVHKDNNCGKLVKGKPANDYDCGLPGPNGMPHNDDDCEVTKKDSSCGVFQGPDEEIKIDDFEPCPGLESKEDSEFCGSRRSEVETREDWVCQVQPHRYDPPKRDYACAKPKSGQTPHEPGHGGTLEDGCCGIVPVLGHPETMFRDASCGDTVPYTKEIRPDIACGHRNLEGVANKDKDCGIGSGVKKGGDNDCARIRTKNPNTAHDDYSCSLISKDASCGLPTSGGVPNQDKDCGPLYKDSRNEPGPTLPPRP